MITDRFASKHAGSRFPAFWGPNFDWIPDHDHGTAGMITVQAMLMQAEGDQIVLLPGWPKAWDVRFRLHAPLNTTVEGVFANGRLRLCAARSSHRASGGFSAWIVLLKDGVSESAMANVRRNRTNHCDMVLLLALALPDDR